MAKAPTIIPGTRYGHLVTTGSYITRQYYSNKKISAKVECKCDCGNITNVYFWKLRDNTTTCCGYSCVYSKRYRHYLCVDENGKRTKEYIAHYNMKNSCTNPASITYKYVGAKGITIHESLSTIEGFLEVLGDAPSKYHRLIRIDKEGDFEPGNVQWYLADGKKRK